MDAVNGLTMTSCFLSIGGATVIFCAYSKIPEFKTEATKILIYLTIADVINASGNLLGTFRYMAKYGNKYDIDEYSSNGTCQDTTDTLCVIQSFMTTSASLASFFWTVFISLHHFLIIRRDRGLKSKMSSIICHVTGWGIPVTVAIIALFSGALGENMIIGSGPWCWIKTCQSSETKPVLWMLYTGKLWECLAYFITGALYGLGKWHLHRESKGQIRQREDIDQEAEEDRKKYGIFWLIFYFYITRLWGTVRYFIYAVNVGRGYSDETIINKADNALLYIQSIGDSSQAFVNFILFCVLGGVMGKFSCCRKTSETDHLLRQQME